MRSFCCIVLAVQDSTRQHRVLNEKKNENFSLNANATLNTNSKKLNQTVGPKIFLFFPKLC